MKRISDDIIDFKMEQQNLDNIITNHTEPPPKDNAVTDLTTGLPVALPPHNHIADAFMIAEFAKVHPKTYDFATGLTLNMERLALIYRNVRLFESIITSGNSFIYFIKDSLAVHHHDKQPFGAMVMLYFPELDLYISSVRQGITELALKLKWYKGIIYQIVKEVEIKGFVFVCSNLTCAPDIMYSCKSICHADSVRLLNHQIYVELHSQDVLQLGRPHAQRVNFVFESMTSYGALYNYEAMHVLNPWCIDNMTVFRLQCNDEDGIHLRT